MRSNQQYEQLMLQYEQLKNGANDIFDMIQKEDYDGAITMLKAREPVFLNCKCMRKFLELSKEQEHAIQEITDELRDLEKRNIELLQKLKDQVEAELKHTNKVEKIQHAYDFDSNNAGTIINVEE